MVAYSVADRTKEINYSFVKPGLTQIFEDTVLEWYELCARLVPQYIPVVTDIFHDLRIYEDSIAFRIFTILEECVQEEYCGVDTFPESLGDWGEDDFMNFEMGVDISEYEDDLIGDIILFLVSKNMTYSICNPDEVEITSVIEVW